MNTSSMLKIGTEDIIIKVPYPIPFYTQIVDFTDKNLQGFKNEEEAKYWQERGCGIVSIKMIIDGFLKYRGEYISESYGSLLYKGLEMGAHCDNGWIHKGLVDIAKKYNVCGKTFRLSRTHNVQKELAKNRPCIVSVTVGFNGGKVNENGEIIKKGGHLVVVKGIVKEDRLLKGFIVNHPSSYDKWNFEDYFVRLEDFKNSFSGTFMSFWINDKK